MLIHFGFTPIETYCRNHIHCILFIPLILLFLVSTVLGQDIMWSRTYGGSAQDLGWDIDETADGGYILVGETYSFGLDLQVYLVKTDVNGDTLWTKVFGGYGFDECQSVQQTSDGGYVLSGATTSYGSYVQAYLIKTRSDGSLQWFRTYGGSDWESSSSVQQTTDGGYILTGCTKSYGAGDYDVYLVKTDSLGTLQWFKTYGGNREDIGNHVEQTSDGGYIIVGHSESFGPVNMTVYVIKTDPEGDTLWTRNYYPPSWGWSMNDGSCCRQTPDGGYIISAISVSDSQRVFLIKTDSNGDTLWTRVYKDRPISWGFSVSLTSDSGYIVVGYTMTPGSDYDKDIYLIKTDSDGDTLWTRTYGDIGFDNGQAVIQATDGSYMVVGATTSCGTTAGDILLLKISPVPFKVLRGDANGDGVFDIGDVVYLLNYLLKNGPPPQPLLAGDTDCNGVVELEDIVNLVKHLFQAGPELGCRCL